ncbi:hypothetical protein EDC96DRAFT_542492 [Choanephora cucurbitarum]|nr:hypothetical protein EDC96DRAFT_542492 [Choanephora cucurbitarum]
MEYVLLADRYLALARLSGTIPLSNSETSKNNNINRGHRLKSGFSAIVSFRGRAVGLVAIEMKLSNSEPSRSLSNGSKLSLEYYKYQASIGYLKENGVCVLLKKNLFVGQDNKRFRLNLDNGGTEHDRLSQKVGDEKVFFPRVFDIINQTNSCFAPKRCPVLGTQ